MLERAAYRFGNTVRWLIRFGSAFVVVLIMTPDPPLAIAAMVLAGDRLAYLTQVLGGLLAAIAVRAEILQFRLGTERPAIRFRVRRTQVSIGIPVGFRMDHGPISVGWRAVVVLGGLLVNLAVAGIALALPLPRAIADSLAVLLVANAVEDLMPIRTKGGDVSAGARLLGLRSHGRSAAVLKDLNAFWDNRDNPAHSPDLTNRVLAAYREGDPVARENVHLLAIMLRREGRVAELAELHAESPEHGEKLDEAHLGAFLEFEWNVVAVPGLPQAEADRAAARLERLLEYLWVPITYATRRYSWIMPPARSRRRTRKWSRSVTPSGSGRSGAAWFRVRCGRCASRKSSYSRRTVIRWRWFQINVRLSSSRFKPTSRRSSHLRTDQDWPGRRPTAN
jgi:hypothetical protein